MSSTEFSTAVDGSVPTLIHIVLWISCCSGGRRSRPNISVDLRFHGTSRAEVPICPSCTSVYNVVAAHCCRIVIHTLTHTVKISPDLRSACAVPDGPGLRCRGRRPHGTVFHVSRGRRACHRRHGCRHRHALVVGSSAPPTIRVGHGACRGALSIAQLHVSASLTTPPPRIAQNARSSTSPDSGAHRATVAAARDSALIARDVVSRDRSDAGGAEQLFTVVVP